MDVTRLSRLGAIATALIGSLASAPALAVTTPPPTFALSEMAEATTPTSFVLEIDVPGASSAKLIIDGVYIGRDASPPLEFDVTVTGGAHRMKVRADVGGDEIRTDVQFTAGAAPVLVDSAPAAPGGGITPGSLPSPTTPAERLPPATPPAPAEGGLVVDTVAEIRHALANARPGDVIVVADGEYTFKPRLVASASGTPNQPITVRGTRNAVIRTKNASGDYGLHITGDHWRVEGLTVAHATKGIVLDGSIGTVIDGVEVYDIGDEAIHFRACSSDGVLRNSHVHDTGRNSPQYGEGVYVGSANSNWDKYQCVDPVEGLSGGDNTERVLIEHNLFEDITAEGADLKEGTDSGILRHNVFRRTGLSGMNSADSAVDAKGNNWLIESNLVTDSQASWDDDGVARPSEFLDGFQTHEVYDGYGTGNVFRLNRVSGSIPGFGIGLYPALANRVECNNLADGAALGTVGNKSRPFTCTG